ncbi:MAG TPA: hypothetical protein VMB77_11140 [Syntrophales bacterium]|nr:hypothetical protein [Syntrophales bacterium]
MAEIKSTIDLIMERTKNLSASPQEREAFRRQERERHLRSLVQKLLDYSLSIDDVKDELEREKKSGRETEAMEHMKSALAGQVDPELDNDRLLRLIHELVGTAEEKLRETVLFCRGEFGTWKNGVMQSRMKELEAKGIAGSAVLPNPEADPRWKARREQLQADCAKRLLTAISG